MEGGEGRLGSGFFSLHCIPLWLLSFPFPKEMPDTQAMFLLPNKTNQIHHFLEIKCNGDVALYRFLF